MAEQTEIEFSGYKWQSGNRWGNYHPKNPTYWCDPSCVDVTSNILRLQTKRHKIVTSDAGVIDIGIGLVTSVDDFGYGRFEAEVMLPKGTGLFPAFWLWGADSWPPEIDIFMDVLQWFENKKMQVVFNNGVDNPSEYTNDSVMLVKNFKYTEW